LSDQQFEFAHTEISKILRQNKDAKKKFISQLKSLQKRLGTLKKNALRFKNYMEFLDKIRTVNISLKDAQKIVSFHNFGYIDDTENFIYITEQALGEKQNHKSTRHYLCGQFDNLNRNLETINYEMKQKEECLKRDLRVLRRNIKLFDRLRMNSRIILKG